MSDFQFTLIEFCIAKTLVYVFSPINVKRIHYPQTVDDKNESLNG